MYLETHYHHDITGCIVLYPLILTLVQQNLCPHPTSYIEILTPSTSESDLIWILDLYKDNRVKMRSLGWVPAQNDRGPYKKGIFGHRYTGKEGMWDAKRHRIMGRGMGRSQPSPRQEERPRTDSPSWLQKEPSLLDGFNQILLDGFNLHLGLLGSCTCDNPFLLSHPVRRMLLRQPRQTNTHLLTFYGGPGALH